MRDLGLSNLATEQPNPASANIDQLSTEAMLRLLNEQDASVPAAVAATIPQITEAIDAITEKLAAGGRLFYSGAGTSGRLGVLDASECPPTFGVPPELVVGLIAGGDHALRNPIEGAEDSTEQGAADLIAHDFSKNDVLAGIAASGRTPYVLGALHYARTLGAVTIAISCVENSAIAEAADIAITPIVGPEVLTGSTRMKAGTATKLVLNMLTTGTMIRLGHVYGNLMVNVRPSNAKLIDRARRILESITKLDSTSATELLSKAGNLKTAIVMHQSGLSKPEAEARLAAHHGHLRQTLGHTLEGLSQ